MPDRGRDGQGHLHSESSCRASHLCGYPGVIIERSHSDQAASNSARRDHPRRCPEKHFAKYSLAAKVFEVMRALKKRQAAAFQIQLKVMDRWSTPYRVRVWHRSGYADGNTRISRERNREIGCVTSPANIPIIAFLQQNRLRQPSARQSQTCCPPTKCLSVSIKSSPAPCKSGKPAGSSVARAKLL